MSATEAGSSALGRDVFNELDQDGDGIITREDIERLGGRLPEAVVVALRSRLRSTAAASTSQLRSASLPAVYVPTGSSALPSARSMPTALPPDSTAYDPSFTRAASLPPQFGVQPSGSMSMPVVPVFPAFSPAPAPGTATSMSGGQIADTAPASGVARAPPTLPPTAFVTTISPGSSMVQPPAAPGDEMVAPASSPVGIGTQPSTVFLWSQPPATSSPYSEPTAPPPPAHQQWISRPSPLPSTIAPPAAPPIPSIEVPSTPAPLAAPMSTSTSNWPAHAAGTQLPESPAPAADLMTPPPMPVLPPLPSQPPVARQHVQHIALSPRSFQPPGSVAEGVPSNSDSAPATAVEVPAAGSAEQVFDMLDRNNDGVISREEYMSALAGQNIVAVSERHPNVAIVPDATNVAGENVQLELDGDVLDPSFEDLFLFRDLDGEITDGPGDLFAQIDRNDDGVITKEEFLRAFASNRRITLHPDALHSRGYRETEWYLTGPPCLASGRGSDERGMDNANLQAQDFVVVSGLDAHAPARGLAAPNFDQHSSPNFNMHAANLGAFAPDFDVSARGINVPDGAAKLNLGEYEPEAKLTWIGYICSCCGLFKSSSNCCRGCFERSEDSAEGTAGCCDACCGSCGTRCDAALESCEACCGDSLYFWCCGAAVKGDALGLSRVFPWLFTFLCFILFAGPILLTRRLGQDMQVRYWITDRLWIVSLLPVLYTFTQWWHYRKATISRILVCFCLVGSCVFLLIVGDMVLLSAHQKANALLAKDCSTDVEKMQLQHQWQNAQFFYSQCMTETASATGSGLEVAYSLYRIQDCAGYSEQLERNPAWPYLGALEQNYNCGGWCTRSQPLWTFKPVKDSCSTTVADVLSNKVQCTMFKVVLYTIVVLGIVSVGLIQAGPIMRSHNVPWK